MLQMSTKISFSLFLEVFGTLLGLLFLQGGAWWVFACMSFLSTALILSIWRMDPGRLAQRNSEYYEHTLFKEYMCRNVLDEGEIVGRSFERKGARMHSEIFCRTCGVFRALGTSHCRECNRCVSEMDHHCIWLNNCIGERNYPYFMNLLSLEVARSGIAIIFRFNQDFPKMEFTVMSVYFYYTLFATCLLGAFMAALFAYFLLLNMRGSTSRAFCKRKRTIAQEKKAI
ncbi:uncharacterized protein NEMAJ01_0635 [Nematocida major]|uniref:uncharacterized protein n=1 Tax=Nematocida major TaxID=1912982 RepID=UPI0020078A4D|nr:uncharacterized protein NEMAJ01_0635 [Nematocida major]KAH9385739.1 hypothetical protein NEMAJ01_0635 [Nematocida major]